VETTFLRGIVGQFVDRTASRFCAIAGA